MSDYSKSVFKNPFFLRQKLNLYLQTPEKTELYARACEKFTKNGLLEWQFSWSWWAFFFPVVFFVLRKHYFAAFVAFFLTNLFPLIFNIIYAMFAKYFVIKRFCKFLRYENDEILVKYGGRLPFIVAIGLIFLAITLLVFLSNIATNNYQEYINLHKI